MCVQECCNVGMQEWKTSEKNGPDKFQCNSDMKPKIECDYRWY